MSDVDDFLEHFGVKGMKWGQNKRNPGGVSRKTSREASKDAKEFTAAKMYYGEGAGTRRKLINAKVNAKSSKDPNYKKAFDDAVGGTDMGRRAEQARGQRKRTDTKNSVKKTARGVGHVVRGNSQYASMAAVVLAGAAGYAYTHGGDKHVKKYGSMAVNTIKREVNIAKTRKFLKNMGI